jgi:hypothetical protein
VEEESGESTESAVEALALVMDFVYISIEWQNKYLSRYTSMTRLEFWELDAHSTTRQKILDHF